MTQHSTDKRKYISKPKTAYRYGKDQRTIARWLNNPDLGFPQPIEINGHYYFEVAELDAFDRRLAAERMRAIADRHNAEHKVAETQYVGAAS